MDTREFLSRYLRSPYGLATTLGAFALGFVVGLSGKGIALAFVVALLALISAMLIGLFTGLGSRAVVAEGERAAGEHGRERMALAAENRKRLATLRLPPGPVATARDLVVLEAGRLVEGFAINGAWDPRAVQAVEDAIALVDAWQREADESATERRFDLPDAHPFPESSERVAAALREKAALISKGRAEAAGEVPAVDRMAIDEELK
ncbi:MAG: hypothetical protein WCL50_11325 [Spirochaetota bacterium]